jgi:hypothetical protein
MSRPVASGRRLSAHRPVRAWRPACRRRARRGAKRLHGRTRLKVGRCGWLSRREAFPAAGKKGSKLGNAVCPMLPGTGHRADGPKLANDSTRLHEEEVRSASCPSALLPADTLTRLRPLIAVRQRPLRGGSAVSI